MSDVSQRYARLSSAFADFGEEPIASPVAKLQREYLERQLQQMPKIEALLERIAKALEHK